MEKLNRISVSIKIPALDNIYEFIVPNDMSVKDVQILIIKILNSEYGISENFSDAMLFDIDDVAALRLECSLEQLGIKDGAKLLLI